MPMNDVGTNMQSTDWEMYYYSGSTWCVVYVNADLL